MINVNYSNFNHFYGNNHNYNYSNMYIIITNTIKFSLSMHTRIATATNSSRHKELISLHFATCKSCLFLSHFCFIYRVIRTMCVNNDVTDLAAKTVRKAYN